MSLTDMSIFSIDGNKRVVSFVSHSEVTEICGCVATFETRLPSATDMTNVHGRESSSFYFNFCVSSKLYIDVVSCHRCGLKPFLLY